MQFALAVPKFQNIRTELFQINREDMQLLPRIVIWNYSLIIKKNSENFFSTSIGAHIEWLTIKQRLNYLVLHCKNEYVKNYTYCVQYDKLWCYKGTSTYCVNFYTLNVSINTQNLKNWHIIMSNKRFTHLLC